jgi:putative intracellular protease/amidase
MDALVISGSGGPRALGHSHGLVDYVKIFLKKGKRVFGGHRGFPPF